MLLPEALFGPSLINREKWPNSQFLQTFTALFREFGYGL
jgi:hypothetical protein